LLGFLLLYDYLTFSITVLDEPIPALKTDANKDKVFKTDNEKLVKHLNNACNVAPVTFLLGESSFPNYWWVVRASSSWHQGWKRGLWALVSVADSCICCGLLFLLKTRMDSVAEIEIEKLIL